MPSSDQAAVAVSIVVPVRNEAENVAPLIAEIVAALDGRWAYEIIYVNDGSTDATGERLNALMKRYGHLRQLRHANSSGQSAAVRSGVRAARGTIVATLDGDGQNNPAFLPDLVAAIESGGGRIGLVAGQRVGRKATGFKKMQSRIANAVRNGILREQRVLCHHVHGRLRRLQLAGPDGNVFSPAEHDHVLRRWQSLHG